ncbi:MAG: FAD-binding protein [Ahrensia sp.]
MSDIHTPTSVEEAIAAINAARLAGSVVSVCGNRSKAQVGSPPGDNAIQLSSAGLSGIDQYNAQELVFVAKAGTPMSEINAALAKNRQQLVFEPADWSRLLGTDQDQTIGGIAATNMSGPRRFVAGAARDSLLGVRFINGQGEHIKNGGQVMKNVTGLDLVKLLGGSWGTLGMLTEVSFKVLPVSETSKTLCITGANDADATKLMAAAMATSCEVSGAAHLPADIVDDLGVTAPFDGSVTLLRLEGLAGSVADRFNRLEAALRQTPSGAKAAITELDDKKSTALWAAIRDVEAFVADQEKPVWRISVAPSAGHQLVAAVQAKTGARAFYDWQGGLVWLALDDADNAHAALVRGAVAATGGGHATLIRASAALRATVPVFQPEPPAVHALNGRIRAAIDPDGLFHAARMSGPAQASAA